VISAHSPACTHEMTRNLVKFSITEEVLIFDFNYIKVINGRGVALGGILICINVLMVYFLRNIIMNKDCESILIFRKSPDYLCELTAHGRYGRHRPAVQRKQRMWVWPTKGLVNESRAVGCPSVPRPQLRLPQGQRCAEQWGHR
jgi:hypothetical protein